MKNPQSKSLKANAALEGAEAERLSEIELALTVLWNSVHRWLSQRNQSTAVDGLSDLDVFLLHLLVYRNKRLRAIDLAFALSIDDMHLVSYALKKLSRLKMIAGAKRFFIHRRRPERFITSTFSRIGKNISSRP
jgi:predicted MarR family transcription regulator